MSSLEKIEDKIDKIYDKLESMLIIQALQENNLKEHMRRTELAEENIEFLREELTPIQVYIERVKGATILLGSISGIIAFVATIYSILEYYK